uniref:probable glutathione S-transferase n=1 Tax=Erigeron canadensis TaxID=72917 RepID=UPI001CB8FA19|nr:probable glutathione S-transferase [Erigeron canadensis]
MADEVKLYGVGGSPFVCRVKIALSLKGIKYENIEEDTNNKSPDLLKYNPVHKQVPVLVHNGKPISESLVILEYIDDVWNKGYPILPQDPYEKAVARFWAKFIDDKLVPLSFTAFKSNGDEQAIAEACEQLKILENELKGKKFFGGDNINLIDITAVILAYWLGAIEEATGIKIVTKQMFPKVTEWADNFIQCETVKKVLPPRAHLIAHFKKLFGKTT